MTRADLRLRQFGAALSGGVAAGVGPDPGLVLLQNSTVWYNENSIVGSTPPTALTNQISGGSAYDADVTVGVAGDISTVTINSLTSIDFTAGDALETTAGVDISGPISVIAVVRFDTVVSNQCIFSARSDSAKEYRAFISSGNLKMDQGIQLDVRS